MPTLFGKETKQFKEFRQDRKIIIKWLMYKERSVFRNIAHRKIVNKLSISKVSHTLLTRDIEALILIILYSHIQN